MFCEKCGKKLREGASFCNMCGAEVAPMPIRQAENNTSYCNASNSSVNSYADNINQTKDNQKSGWDRIAEMEARNTKAKDIYNKADTTSEITSYVGWIIVIAIFVIVLLALFGVFGLKYLF